MIDSPARPFRLDDAPRTAVLECRRSTVSSVPHRSTMSYRGRIRLSDFRPPTFLRAGLTSSHRALAP